MDLVWKSGAESVILITGTAQELPEFIDFHTEDGEQIAYPGTGEAVISDKLAKEYHLQAGDSITLRDENMRSLEVTVSGIY